MTAVSTRPHLAGHSLAASDPLQRLAAYARVASRRRGLTAGELAEDIAEIVNSMTAAAPPASRGELPVLPFLHILAASFPPSPRIRTACDPAMTLPAEKLVAVGMIASEALENTLRHGFPQRSDGNVWISLSENHARLTLSIRDNGVGMPDLDSSSYSGRGLIGALAQHLGGDARLGSVQFGGAEVLVVFPRVH